MGKNYTKLKEFKDMKHILQFWKEFISDLEISFRITYVMLMLGPKIRV